MDGRTADWKEWMNVDGRTEGHMGRMEEREDGWMDGSLKTDKITTYLVKKKQA